MSPSKKGKRGWKARTQKLKFVEVSHREASGRKPKHDGHLSGISVVSDINLRRLIINDSQRNGIENIYRDGTAFDRIFDNGQESQIEAVALVASNELDEVSREALGSRWSIRWTNGSAEDTGVNGIYRVLYQCDCGYNHESLGVKRRRTAVDFTGCLAHAEVTMNPHTQKILRVRGYLEHNDECCRAEIKRRPIIPLHPDVLAMALRQLRLGIPLAEVQSTNQHMYDQCAYPNMPANVNESPFRWLIRKTDTRSLYRQANRVAGVDTSQKAHHNVHRWLDPKSDCFNKALAQAVFHYSARTAMSGRFEACVATPEMNEAAWKYGHKSQILLDGTFGICNRKILLFILMGIDEGKKGVPLAFFLFSAPSGNRFTAAGYNSGILAHLLRKWRTNLGMRGGEYFSPLVAITDTDLMERIALVCVFKGIWLLICRFHLRQSWKNHLNRSLAGNSPAHRDCKERLYRIQAALLDSASLEQAHQIILAEEEVLRLNRDPNSGDAEVIEQAMKHLSYLHKYWSTKNLWQSWSNHGRIVAAKILKCKVEGVLTTTNHLESFNGLLKNRLLKKHQRGSRRLRLDVLLLLLTTQVLPAIFKKRRIELAEDARIEAQVRVIRGGESVLNAVHQQNLLQDGSTTRLAYLDEDNGRDAAARQILQSNQLSAPEPTEEGLSFSCYSSLSLAADVNPVTYNIILAFDGNASCSCLDFVNRGGACKHMRAALMSVHQLQRNGLPIPPIPIPASREGALAMHRYNTDVSRLVDDLALVDFTTEANLHNVDHDPILQAALAVDDILREVDDIDEADASDVCEDGLSWKDIETDDELDGLSDGLSDASGWGWEKASSGSDSEFEFASAGVVDDQSDDDAQPHFSRLMDDRTWGVKRGVEEQAISRVLQDLQTYGPKLQQLSIFLEGVSGLTLDVEQLGQTHLFSQELGSLSAQLSRIIKEANLVGPAMFPRPKEPSSSLHLSTPPRTLATPNDHANQSLYSEAFDVSLDDILPPSPEKAQTRKTSYSIH